jgi:hypothetical protein
MGMASEKVRQEDRGSLANPEIKHRYLEALKLIEQVHRRLLDVIKDEFDREGLCEINSVQALLLFNIGSAELTAGELKSRGHYLGSNVSYNLKKLDTSITRAPAPIAARYGCVSPTRAWGCIARSTASTIATWGRSRKSAG